MEDIFKFLFVIGIIAIGFVRQARKEAKTSTGNGPAMPMPDAESPFPENWNGVPYDGYNPENPGPEVSAPRKKAAKKHKSAPKQPPVCQTPTICLPNHRASSQFEIHSAEEARKAITGRDITTKVLMRLKIS